MELPVQSILMGITAEQGLTLFRGDATDAYANSPAPSETCLIIDKAYVD